MRFYFIRRLDGRNGVISRIFVLPLSIKSDIIFPVTGAYNIPQHPCAVAIHNPLIFGMLPMIGTPFLLIGRWHACSFIILAVGWFPFVFKNVDTWAATEAKVYYIVNLDWLKDYFNFLHQCVL